MFKTSGTIKQRKTILFLKKVQSIIKIILISIGKIEMTIFFNVFYQIVFTQFLIENTCFR